MKINSITKPISRFALPLLVTASISSTALATNLQGTKPNIIELNKTTFDKADKNNDGTLNYTEFVSINKVEETSGIKAAKPANKNISIGLGLAALALAVADIFSTYKKDKKKNP